MPPRRIDPTSDDIDSYLNQSQATGNLNWQELAHLDFQELIDLTRNKKSDSHHPAAELDFEERVR